MLAPYDQSTASWYLEQSSNLLIRSTISVLHSSKRSVWWWMISPPQYGSAEWLLAHDDSSLLCWSAWVVCIILHWLCSHRRFCRSSTICYFIWLSGFLWRRIYSRNHSHILSFGWILELMPVDLTLRLCLKIDICTVIFGSIEYILYVNAPLFEQRSRDQDSWFAQSMCMHRSCLPG